MHITFKHGSWYEVKRDPDTNKKKWIKLTNAEYLAKKREKRMLAVKTQPPDITDKDLVDYWFDIYTYSSKHWGTIKKFYSGRPLCKVDPMEMTRQGWGWSCVRNRICDLRKFFDWLIDKGVVRENPARDVELPRIYPEGYRPKWRTPEEVAKWLDCVKEPTRTYCFIIYRLGLRPVEFFRIKPEDIDARGKLLRVTAKGLMTMKPLDDELLALLQSIDQPKKKLCQAHLDAACIASGIHITPYMLRHSFATSLHKQTHDIYLVSKALGHKRVTTTQIYADIDNDDLRAGFASVNLPKPEQPDNVAPTQSSTRSVLIRRAGQKIHDQADPSEDQ